VEKDIPEYLRLHIERHESSVESDLGREAWRSFRRQFADATGWKLSSSPYDDQPSRSPSVKLREVEVRADGGKNKRRLERGAAEELAATFAEVYSELEVTRKALRCREAELAACVPVSPRADEEQHLAERLEVILRTGAEAVNCHSAAVYLLDDATSQLKLRSSWGIAPQKILEPPRELRGAAADLEALLGHAVVLYSPMMMEYWRAPLSGGSAVCVPVSSPTIPLGTLWLSCDEARDFTPIETNILEIIAGRIAADLEREILIEEGITLHHLRDQVERFAQSQADRVPTVKPDVDGWEMAAWSTQSQSLGGTMYDWGVASDGGLFGTLASVPGTPLVGSSSAASIQLATRCLLDLPLEIDDIVQRMNEALWQTAVGEGPASLALAKATPEKARCELVLAGDARAYHLLAKEVRKLTPTGPSIGADDLSQFTKGRLTLRQGQTLLLASPSFATAENAAGVPYETRLGAFDRSGNRTANGLVEQLRANWLTHCGASTPVDATIVAITRRRM
jgi:sigma-B regulation protein RsbU (phosphoserine phosphatase)